MYRVGFEPTAPLAGGLDGVPLTCVLTSTFDYVKRYIPANDGEEVTVRSALSSQTLLCKHFSPYPS
jgi:hypothetical protein